MTEEEVREKYGEGIKIENWKIKKVGLLRNVHYGVTFLDIVLVRGAVYNRKLLREVCLRRSLESVLISLFNTLVDQDEIGDGEIDLLESFRGQLIQTASVSDEIVAVRNCLRDDGFVSVTSIHELIKDSESK